MSPKYKFMLNIMVTVIWIEANLTVDRAGSILM